MAIETKTADRPSAKRTPAEPYAPRKYDHLFGMAGFSEKLLSDHFKLYEAYVANVNRLIEKSDRLRAAGGGAEEADFKRRFGWEFNGMRLHEYYFENLGGNGQPEKDFPIVQQLAQQFHSLEAWKADFLTTGALRGIGWAVLYEDNWTGRLVNAWIEQHDGGHLSGCQPILIMDVFEHAYAPDYRLDKKKYMEAFMANVHWDIVNDRYVGETSNRY